MKKLEKWLEKIKLIMDPYERPGSLDRTDAILYRVELLRSKQIVERLLKLIPDYFWNDVTDEKSEATTFCVPRDVKIQQVLDGVFDK